MRAELRAACAERQLQETLTAACESAMRRALCAVRRASSAERRAHAISPMRSKSEVSAAEWRQRFDDARTWVFCALLPHLSGHRPT